MSVGSGECSYAQPGDEIVVDDFGQFPAERQSRRIRFADAGASAGDQCPFSGYSGETGDGRGTGSPAECGTCMSSDRTSGRCLWSMPRGLKTTAAKLFEMARPPAAERGLDTEQLTRGLRHARARAKPTTQLAFDLERPLLS
jgi:hypothetical protein